jgi:hypothetical protein
MYGFGRTVVQVKFDLYVLIYSFKCDKIENNRMYDFDRTVVQVKSDLYLQQTVR